MIYKEHLIELWVNGSKVELEDQKSLNMRFNNVLIDPTKISNTQAEYSFEFEIPCTPNNNKIFDYANVLSKPNKFHARYNAKVYADGSVIFNGSLTLNGVKDNMYKCNLVNVKTYSLEDIFGDDNMDDIKWSIPFNGAGTSNFTIDYYNSHQESGVTFPFISYGAFQKSPYYSDEVANDYTSKFDLDEYNRWYVESFYPSPNMLETVRKAFESKGYTVGGDAFNSPNLNDIYLSGNLADGQVPTYNLGNPKFGKVSLSASISTSGKSFYEQELNFPYYLVKASVNRDGNVTTNEEYNLSSINMYSIMGNGNVTVNSSSYMYQPNERLIVIPSDGWYKIDMQVSSRLNTTGQITVPMYKYTFNLSSIDFSKRNIDVPASLEETTPIEVVLVKNYDDNYELIKGKRNKRYVNGDPTQETFCDILGNCYNNIIDWLTCYPHEDPYASVLPTEKNDLKFVNSQTTYGGSNTQGHPYGGQRAASTSTHHHNWQDRNYRNNVYGYMYNNGTIMAYDQAVSEAFICGFSSFYGGVASVMKNGYSWSTSNSSENFSMYPQIGYSLYTKTSASSSTIEQTSFNKNTYPSSPNAVINANATQMNGTVRCMVYLHKNDVLELMAIHRNYDDVTYNTTTSVNLTIEAASPKSIYELRKENFGYNSPTQFDVNLNVANFFNKEKKISEWMQNIFDAYNLEMSQDGYSVFINTKKNLNTPFVAAVDVDNRVNSNEAETQKIKYPRYMAVKYKIDTEEWGAERSAVESQGGDESILNYDDWKKYIDSGYTVITLSDDDYETSKSEKSLQFSYTWYDNFNWYTVNSSFVKDESIAAKTLRIPVISKYTYMIDGYDYDESMKHDGFGLSQRFWYKPIETEAYVWTRTYPAEKVKLYVPSNLKDGINLSYKNTETSLLKEYFNVNAYLSSNYVTIEVYLSPQEYDILKDGACVRFDKDIYKVCEIQGYDATCNNPCELKMMKM